MDGIDVPASERMISSKGNISPISFLKVECSREYYSFSNEGMNMLNKRMSDFIRVSTAAVLQVA